MSLVGNKNKDIGLRDVIYLALGLVRPEKQGTR